MSEQAIEETVDYKAKMYGYLVRKIAWQGRRNAPDKGYIGGPKNRFVLIEFKKKGEVPRPTQQRELDRLSERYHDVHWVDNVEDALDILGIPHD